MYIKDNEYWIRAVKYNKERTRIEEVKIGEPVTMENEKVFTRQELLDSMREGKQFFTALKTAFDIWRKGPEVLIVTINNEKYIKTINSIKETDDLGKLSEFNT